MKYLYTGILLVCFSTISLAQNQESYGQFSNKEAKKLLKSAQKEYNYGNFSKAEEKYSTLLKNDSTNVNYNFGQAQVYYDNFQQPKSIPFFERAIKYSKDTIGEAYYFLANSYHLNSQYDLAKKNYNIYLSLVERRGTPLSSSEETDLKNDLKHRIEMCDNGKKLSQFVADKFTINGKTRAFQIINAGKGVNSEFDDYDGILSSNDSLLYFTSRRQGTTGGKLDWDDKYFEDIYVSQLGKDGWEQNANIGVPINTEKHEAIISISPDGNTIYFYKGIKQGTFFMSKKGTNGVWSKPEIIYQESDINSKAWETSMFGFTLSGNELYVVSDREGGLGGRDIYVTKKQKDGSWGPLENLGEPINTQYDEDAPFITADGKTMYFSSTGHNSMGGFDIFKSERNGDKWSEPVNLGAPFNTPGNDIYFIIANKSDRAYYSSNNIDADGKKDMNIYMIDLCDDIPITTINGLAQGIQKGTITVSEKGSGKVVENVEIADGKYSFKVEPGKNYSFTFNASGMESESMDVYIPKQCKNYELYQELAFTQPGQPLTVKNAFFDIKKEAGETNYSEFLAKADKGKLSGYSESSVKTNPIMTVKVDTVKTTTETTTTASVKTTISFNNVLFDFNKSQINKEFKTELDKAVDILKNKDSKIKIEIDGYTDSKGTAKYNLALSKRRAMAVANYLSAKGIKNRRMKTVGFGAEKPLAPNQNSDGSDNPEGRAKNRRTEIIVIQ